MDVHRWSRAYLSDENMFNIQGSGSKGTDSTED